MSGGGRPQKYYACSAWRTDSLIFTINGVYRDFLCKSNVCRAGVTRIVNIGCLSFLAVLILFGIISHLIHLLDSSLQATKSNDAAQMVSSLLRRPDDVLCRCN